MRNNDCAQTYHKKKRTPPPPPLPFSHLYQWGKLQVHHRRPFLMSPYLLHDATLLLSLHGDTVCTTPSIQVRCPPQAPPYRRANGCCVRCSHCILHSNQ